MSYVNPPYNDQHYTVFGLALVSNGLFVFDSIWEPGLLLNGLMWPCADIWAQEPALSTSWSDSDTSITTTWSNSDSSITTTWSDFSEAGEDC